VLLDAEQRPPPEGENSLGALTEGAEKQTN